MKHTHKQITMKATITDKGEWLDLVNVDFTKEGYITKRKGWRTFDEMIRVLEQANRTYKKFKSEGDFTIRLPLPRSRGKNRIVLKEEKE